MKCVSFQEQSWFVWSVTFEPHMVMQTHRLSPVDKWIKQNKMDLLGIPSCVGFGLHLESYRCGHAHCKDEFNINTALL